MKDVLWPFVFIFLCLWLYLGYEEDRQARIERMVMRLCDLVEQGKITDEDAKKLHEVLK